MVENRFTAQMNETEESVSITMTLSLEEVEQRKAVLERRIKNCKLNIKSFTEQLFLLQQELDSLNELAIKS